MYVDKCYEWCKAWFYFTIFFNFSIYLMENNRVNNSFGGGSIATGSDISKFMFNTNNYIDNNFPNNFRQLYRVSINFV
jgi:hypothetical protein